MWQTTFYAFIKKNKLHIAPVNVCVTRYRYSCDVGTAVLFCSVRLSQPAYQMPCEDDTLLAARTRVLVTSFDMDCAGVMFHKPHADGKADRTTRTPQGCFGLLNALFCVSLCSYYCQHFYGKCCYFLTPWCRVLLEKLTCFQAVKKFPAFYGTRRFITAFTSFRHPSLSWASPIQSTCPQPTSWRSILILSTHLRLGLPIGSFPPVSPPGPLLYYLIIISRHNGNSLPKNCIPKSWR